jgi:hypothetical protein
MTGGPIRYGEVRYEYEQVTGFDEVQDLAADGWRLIHMAMCQHPVTADYTVAYVMERTR